MSSNEEAIAIEQQCLSDSDSAINVVRKEPDVPIFLEILGYIKYSFLAMVGALVPAWIASAYVGIDNGVLIFCALLILIGCMFVTKSMGAIAYWGAKNFDAVNSLRFVLKAQTERLSSREK